MLQSLLTSATTSPQSAPSTWNSTHSLRKDSWGNQHQFLAIDENYKVLHPDRGVWRVCFPIFGARKAICMCRNEMFAIVLRWTVNQTRVMMCAFLEARIILRMWSHFPIGKEIFSFPQTGTRLVEFIRVVFAWDMNGTEYEIPAFVVVATIMELWWITPCKHTGRPDIVTDLVDQRHTMQRLNKFRSVSEWIEMPKRIYSMTERVYEAAYIDPFMLWWSGFG